VVVQLGANWIHGLHDSNPLFTTAQALQLDLFETSSDNAPGNDVCLFDVGDGGGRSYPVVPSDLYQAAMARFQWISENLGSVMGCEEEGTGLHLSLSEALPQVIVASENCTLPFGVCSSLELRCLHWCFDRIAIDCAAPMDCLSVSYFHDRESDGKFGEALVSGGLHRVLRYLAVDDPLLSAPLDFRLNKRVSSVAAAPAAVDGAGVQLFEVMCSDGELYLADAVLCTLPVGVLQSGYVTFNLRAASSQLEELCKMQSGLMNLAWLWYPSQFWPDEFSFFGLARSGDSGGCASIINDGDRDGNQSPNHMSPPYISTFLAPPMFDQFGSRQPIILCQLAGDFAEHSETMDNAQFAEYATDILRRMFPTVSVPAAIGCVHSRWRSDPLSLGSYSVCPHPSSMSTLCTSPIGGNGDSSVTLTDDAVVGCQQGLYFAGEALSEDHPATAHGAFLSGEHEAEEILRFLGTSTVPAPDNIV
jgi:hypothetical protein